LKRFDEEFRKKLGELQFIMKKESKDKSLKNNTNCEICNSECITNKKKIE
jgi:hypothetical protein